MNGKKKQNYRFLLWELVKKGIKLKYRRSYLGIIWTLIEPILTTIVLTIVFGTIFHKSDKSFAVYILTGRMLYSYFSTSTNATMKSIRANASMIKKVYVPKILYPLANSLYTYIIFLISLIVLAGAMIIRDVHPTLNLLWVWIPLLQLFLLSFGIGLILVTIEVPFRDMEYMWNVCLLIIMYASAIFYDADTILESKYALLMKCNPLYMVIRTFRHCVLGTAMEWNWVIYGTICSVGSVLVGYVLFKMNEDKFILHI